MRPDQAGPARVLRLTGGRWHPIGPILPPIDDPAMHDDHAHRRRICWWHLPAGIAQPGDRLICRERAWEFLDRCGRNHWATIELADYFEVGVDELLHDRDIFAVRPIRQDP